MKIIIFILSCTIPNNIYADNIVRIRESTKVDGKKIRSTSKYIINGGEDVIRIRKIERINGKRTQSTSKHLVDGYNKWKGDYDRHYSEYE